MGKLPVLALAAACWLAGTALVCGESALDQIRSASSIPALDLGRLKKGEILSNRGSLGKFGRGIYGESCYFIHAPAVTVREKLKDWNPLPHRELGVLQIRSYQWPALPDIWETIELDDGRNIDEWLIERTVELGGKKSEPRDLHVTRTEASGLQKSLGNGTALSGKEKETVINDFWRGVLRARSEALAHGGLPAIPAYTVGGVTIETRREVKDLLGLAPKITDRFQPLLGAAPFTQGIGPDHSVSPYRETSLIRGHTGLQLGFVVSRPVGDHYQLIDCSYYVSDTYFISISLYEIWPQDNGSIVWQTDFVSAPFRSYTAGLDRIFGSGEMLKEAAQTARAFRSDVIRGR